MSRGTITSVRKQTGRQRRARCSVLLEPRCNRSQGRCWAVTSAPSSGGMLLSQLIFCSPNNGRKPESKPQLISLGRSPHKGGINCLSLGDSGSSSCKVFSGGFDKSVVLWCIKQERSSFKSKVKTLPIKHKAYISALACRGETLLSASGKNVRLSDICSNSSEAEVASAQFGTNSPSPD